jgi:DNA-directed RNA polymerase subunit alpha
MPPASVHSQTTEDDMAVTRIPIPAWAKLQKIDNRLELSLAEIDLSVRTVNCLEEDKIFTVQDLLQCTPERLLRITNLGEKTIEVIYAALEKIGFSRSPKQSVEQVDEPPAKDFALLRE